MTSCAQRTGFLTLTTCGAPAVAACVTCGKAICAGHMESGPAGPLCPDCAVLGIDADEASRRGLDSSYYRRSVDSDTGMVTYSASDYDSFEGGGGEMGGAGAGGEWDEGEGAEDSDSEGAGDSASGIADDSDSGSSDDFQDS